VQEIDHADPIAIGDQVHFLDAGQGRGIITEILPRRSRLSRPLPVPGQRVFEQVIVSNADQVLTVFSAASPTPKWGLLDRYLVTAEAAGLPSQIIITKMDLAHKNDSLERPRCLSPHWLLNSFGLLRTGEGLDKSNKS
jgi:ribosome biogenesis GTPase